MNEFYDAQFFNNKSFTFLCYMVREGRLRKKNELYINLDFSEMNLYQKDIKSLIEVNFKNLRYLDLSFNFIGPQGCYNLIQCSFPSLESLNLDCNKIGDEGIIHISKSLFSGLNYLYLSNNYISSEGIKSLVKAGFIQNLKELSLDDNMKIRDLGIRIIKEHRGWNKITLLSLNKTGLTDISLTYLGESNMPKLKYLNVRGNNFGEQEKILINALGMLNIKVYYRDLHEDIDLSDEDDKLIFNRLIKYRDYTQKKEKRNKSRKNKIKENYIITQNSNNSTNLSVFNKLKKYLNF